MYLVIGPGLQSIREKVYELVQDEPKLFNIHQSRLYPQWQSIYKRSLAPSKEYEDKGQDEIRTLLQEKLNRFKETDLPKIEAVMGRLRAVFPASETATVGGSVIVEDAAVRRAVGQTLDASNLT